MSDPDGLRRVHGAARRAGAIAAKHAAHLATAATCSASPSGRPIQEQRLPSAPCTKVVKNQIISSASGQPSSNRPSADDRALHQEHPHHLPRVAPIARRMPISRRFCTTDTTSTLAMPSTTTTSTIARIMPVLTDCALSAETSWAFVSCQLSASYG